jgi:hypothetical protein
VIGPLPPAIALVAENEIKSDTAVKAVLAISTARSDVRCIFLVLPLGFRLLCHRILDLWWNRHSDSYQAIVVPVFDLAIGNVLRREYL